MELKRLPEIREKQLEASESICVDTEPKKMYRRLEPYRFGLGEHWRRQIGDVSPTAFTRRIGGCEVWKPLGRCKSTFAVCSYT